MASITEHVGRVPRCRACGLPGAEGRRMIAGPGVHLCEACLAGTATPPTTADARVRCSFCARSDLPIAGAWPSIAICATCADTARSVLAEDERRS